MNIGYVSWDLFALKGKMMMLPLEHELDLVRRDSLFPILSMWIQLFLFLKCGPNAFFDSLFEVCEIRRVGQTDK